MFSESDNASGSLKEEFARALQLLYSTKESSAEELRALLDLNIAKHKKASTPRIPRCTNVDSLQLDAIDPESSASSFEDYQDIRRKFTDLRGNYVGGKDEVPRISIPDEEQIDDGAVCKVCNVPEFGTLILIQCRVCGEHYHPLCHQPPICDVRIHNSDFLWRCNDCDRKRSIGDYSSKEAFSRDSTWIRRDEEQKYSVPSKSIKANLRRKRLLCY